MPEAEFVLKLRNEGSAGAKLLGNDIKSAGDQVVDAMAKLRNMENALRNLKKGGEATAASASRMTEAVKMQRIHVAKLQAGYLHMGGTLDRAKKQTISAGVASKALATGALSVASAMAAVAAAAGAAAVALALYAFKSADARRSELLRLEGMTKARHFGAMGFGMMRRPDRASDLQLYVDELSDKVALGREKLIEYASGLHRAGLRGGALKDTLEGMAYAGSAAGDGQAQLYKSMAMGAALMGTSTKKLAEDAKARFGGVVEKQLLSADVQTRKLKENLGMLFADLKIEGILRGFKAVNDLLSQQTVTGKAIRNIMSRVFQPISDFVGGPIGSLMKGFLQGLVIGALRLELAFYKTRNALYRAFGKPDITTNIDLINVAANAAALGVQLMAAAVGGLAISLAVLGVELAIVSLPFIMLASAVWMAYDMITRPKWDGAGMKIIDGIREGLRAGAKQLLVDMRALGDDIMMALKSKLQIASPSRVMMRLGMQIPRGLQRGIQLGTPQVDHAVRHMVKSPELPSGRAPGSQAVNITLAPGSVVVNGSTSGPEGDQLAAMVERVLEEVGERILLQMGAA